MADKVSWLQISDLHMFEELDSQFNIDDYEVLAKVIHPQFILVTGDFRHKTKQPSFDLALKHLNKIVEVFGLSKDSVYLVPGNHDLNDYDKRVDNITMIGDKLSKPTPDYMQYKNYMVKGDNCLLNGFEDYTQFVREFYKDSGVSGERVDNPASVFCSCWKSKINIIHINSSLISGIYENGVRKYQDIVDVETLSKCVIENPNLPTIAIGHNALKDIYPAILTRFNRLMAKRKIQAYISGDVHQMAIEYAPKLSPTDERAAISGPKSAPESGDDYSDIGVIYYTWDQETGHVDMEAFSWDVNGFKPSPKFKYEVDKNWYFILKDNCKKTKNKEKVVARDVDVNSEMFIDELGHLAYKKHMEDSMARAIMMQEVGNKNKSAKRVNASQLQTLCDVIMNSSASCPLIIKGMPGTGKSTLLTLLYLRMKNQSNMRTFLFDLHYLDKINKKEAAQILDRAVAHAETIIRQNHRTLLFIDGFNQYKRRFTEYEDQLRKAVSTWQSNSNVQIVCTLGIQDSKQYPPFERYNKAQLIESEKTLTLQPIDVLTDKFSYLLTTVLKIKFNVNDKNSQNKNKLVTYCGTIDDGISCIRTAWFLVKQYEILGNTIFNTSPGKLFHDYYLNKLGIKKMKTISKYATEFLMEKPKKKMADVVALKGPATLDFFFAYYYVKAAIDDDMILFVKELDCIFTSRINRFVMQIAQLDSNTEETFVDNLTLIFDECTSINTKIQIAYFLGRAKVSMQAVNDATTFLQSQFWKLLSTYKKSSKERETVMLLRSIGISLLYLGDHMYEKEFYSLIIYDEAMNRINRDFHIAYYTTSSYKLTDKNIFDKKVIYELQNIKNVYNFLYHSVEKSAATKTRCINIITIISLVIYWKYDLKNMEHTTDEFNGFEELLNSLAIDQSIPDVIRDYVLATYRNLKKESLYEESLTRLYSFKQLERTGWKKRGINEKVRTESDADHTWACCILANILLPSNIYDCELVSDFENYTGYDKQKVIQLLLVHDLAECITGDIATPDQTSRDVESELHAINDIRALGAFPGLSALYDIADECNEFRQRDNRDIANVNVQIASDIDRLEPLIQLYYYRKYLREPYDFNEVEKWISDKKFWLHTSFGNELFDLMKRLFLNQECFKREE